MVKIEGSNDKFFLELEKEELESVIMDILTSNRYKRTIQVAPGLDATFQTLLAKEQTELLKGLEDIDANSRFGIQQAGGLRSLAAQLTSVGDANEVTLEYLENMAQPIIAVLGSWLEVFNNMVKQACEGADLGNSPAP